MCSSAPDTSGINRAAEANIELGREALDWYKQAYADQAPAREAAAARAQAVSDAQLRAMDVATTQAQKDATYRETVFQPLERGIVRDAENFDTEGERERLAGLALGDVNQQFEAARETGARNLTRVGVNPNDGKFVGLSNQINVAQALAGADAMNKSRASSIALGRALKMDAAGLGRGLASSQATQQQIALNTGNSSAGNAQVPVQLAQQGTAQVGQGMSLAGNLNSSAGNMYGTIANMESQADSANSSAASGVASAAMMAIAI